MASIRTVRRSPYYIACITLPSGKRTTRTTGIRNDGRPASYAKALRFAQELESDHARQVDARKAARVIKELFEERTGRALPSATVTGWARQWLEQKEGRASPASIDAYRHLTNSFLRWLGEPLVESQCEGTRDIVTITEDDIRAWCSAERSQVSPRTVNNGLRALRMLFHGAVRAGLISSNPAEDVTPLKSRPQRRRPFTVDELRKLVAVADDEWQSMIRVALYTGGQRLKDVALMRWEWFDFSGRELRFETSKTGKALALPLSRHLVAALLPRVKPIGYLHPGCAGIVESSHGRTNKLSAAFHEIMATAGLVESRRGHRKVEDREGRKRPRSEISFHSLRDTATSLLKSSGVSGPVVEEFVGHDSPAMNRIYTKIDWQALDAAAGRLPEI